MLTERSVDVLHGQLEDLDVPGTSRFTCSELLDESSLDISAVSKTICLLCQRLQRYREGQVPLNASCTSLDEALGNVCLFYPKFNSKGTYPVYRALYHLCAQLQTRRLAQAQSGSAQRIETVAANSKVMFQMAKICSNLDVDSSGMVETSSSGSSSALMSQLFAEVRSKIESLQARVSAADRQPLLELPGGAREFSAEQRAVLEELQESSYGDYHRRRCMMLQRVDVTIQGFLWGDGVAGKEGEIVAAIQAQRRELSEFPCKYTIADILSAPRCLLAEFTRSVSTSATMQRNKSLVKTLIIGAVPDRGGRVTEKTMRNANLSSFGSGFGGGGGGGGFKKNNHGGHGKGGGGGGGGNNKNNNQNSGNARKKQRQGDSKDADRVVKFA